MTHSDSVPLACVMVLTVFRYSKLLLRIKNYFKEQNNVLRALNNVSKMGPRSLGLSLFLWPSLQESI